METSASYGIPRYLSRLPDCTKQLRGLDSKKRKCHFYLVKEYFPLMSWKLLICDRATILVAFRR
jgi:hypothetical protein